MLQNLRRRRTPCEHGTETELMVRSRQTPVKDDAP
jgi:hypothetical protein